MRLVEVVCILGMTLAVAGCTRPAILEATATALASPSPMPIATASAMPTHLVTAASTIRFPTPEPIILAATKGNVFIRRGPDLAFDPVGVLMDGQSARALARDVLSKWVQISIPGRPGKTGWVSIQTHFAKLTGDATKLPEINPTDWPITASLRNCTRHAMEADPGGILIAAFTDFPENDVVVNPGIYTIYDIAIDGSPQVTQVEVREGLHIDIRIDGDGNHHKCPVP